MSQHDEGPGGHRTGLVSALGAYIFWGLFPTYLLTLRAVDADQILAHRVLWAVPFGLIIIAARNQWADVRRAFLTPAVLLRLGASALIIGLNWLVYILAVNGGRIFEASLGYYMSPLVYVLVGVVVLKDRLGKLQQAAVLLAATGVAILALYGGQLPVAALSLSISFTAYGFIRKITPVGAMPGLFVETLILAPFGALWLWLVVPAQDAVFGTGTLVSLLLMAAGPVTVVPLLLFAIAARRLTLSAIGFLQFIAPTIVFFIGLAEGEAFTLAHRLCFGFIWAAAALFIFDAVRAPAVPPAGPEAKST